MWKYKRVRGSIDVGSTRGGRGSRCRKYKRWEDLDVEVEEERGDLDVEVEEEGGDLDVEVEEVGRDLDWEIELVEVI